MAKIYLAWNENKTECVGFDDLADASFASNGFSATAEYSTLAEAFRETYADGDDDAEFEMTVVEF